MNAAACRALPVAVLLTALGSGCDCQRRRPIPVGPDAGPAVEWVDRGGPAVQVIAQPLIDEREPNDERPAAQPLEPGKGARGTLQPPKDGQPDEDWYSYLVQIPGAEPAPPQGPQAQEVLGTAQALQAELVPGKGADLSLELLDGEGRRLVLLDDRGAGEAERAELGQRLGQTVYLRVRASPRQKAVLSGHDAAYQLLLRQAAAPAGGEAEPNDTPAQACEVKGGLLSGQLGWKKDEDWFAVPLEGVPDGGVAKGTILRVELQAPGLTAALRIVAPGEAQIVEVKGEGDLRLRNVALPAGAQRVLLGLRALGARRGADGRYQLRVGTEPPLEGAEVEPNDRCEQASALPGGASGEAAGFLWPGDEDCYRLPLPGPSLVTFRLVQAEECQARLSWPGEPEGQRELQGLRRSGEALIRVIGKPRRGCFDTPYRLQYQVAPDPGARP